MIRFARTRKLVAAGFVALISVSTVAVTAAPAEAKTGSGWCC